jgi:hypothetical protein
MLRTALRAAHTARLLAVAGVLLIGTACGSGETTAPPLTELDEMTYAVSNILLDTKHARGPEACHELIRKAYEKLRNGAAFADVAREYSDDPSRVDGGFLGFLNPASETTFNGAIQATPPGHFSMPFNTKIGLMIVYRHPFQEGRALEEKLTIPTLGFAIRYGKDTGRTSDQAASAARDAVKALRDGSMTMLEARRRWAPEDERRETDNYFGTLNRRPETEAMFDAMKAVAPGEVADAFAANDAWLVLQRAKPLKALVRHILVGHAKFDPRIPRTPEQARARAEEVLARIKADPSEWDRQVIDASDDERSRGNRGTLPILGPGSMDQAMEDAIRSVGPNTLVPYVVDTPMGSQIIFRVH